MIDVTNTPKIGLDLKRLEWNAWREMQNKRINSHKTKRSFSGQHVLRNDGEEIIVWIGQ